MVSDVMLIGVESKIRNGRGVLGMLGRDLIGVDGEAVPILLR